MDVRPSETRGSYGCNGSADGDVEVGSAIRRLDIDLVPVSPERAEGMSLRNVQKARIGGGSEMKGKSDTQH